MKRNRLWLLLLVTFLIACACAVLLLGSKQTEPRDLRLEMVRQTEVQGQPVLFFGIEGADSKRLFISSVAISSAKLVVGRADKFALRLGRVLDSSGRFWNILPLQDFKLSREEFAVTVPTNCQAWNLRVTLKLEDSTFERLSSDWKSFKGTLKAGGNLGAAIRFSMSQPHEGYTTLMSDSVTNYILDTAASGENH